MAAIACSNSSLVISVPRTAPQTLPQLRFGCWSRQCFNEIHSQWPILRDNRALFGGLQHGEEEQACSKTRAQASETSGMGKTTGPRTQGSLPGQDAGCCNFKADKTDARRATHEGKRPRIGAWASSVAAALSPP